MSPEPCPFLPLPERAYTVRDIQALGKDRDAEFYHAALNYAQTLWLEGFPAKTLLFINRALSCNLPDISLQNPYNPFKAVAWVLHQRPADTFIGNPRRHYQHLATRMVEPHKPLRVWRAWACWSLSKRLLPENEYPADLKQITEEGIVEPRHQDIEEQLRALSPNNDAEAWLAAYAWAESQTLPRPSAITSGEIIIKTAALNDLSRVQSLAQFIWPQVYAEIISQEQIQYMLDNMYALPVLLKEVRERNICYALMMASSGEDVGYLAWEPNPGAGNAFIHKLYVSAAYHGRGVGALGLQWIHREAARQGLQRIGLRVNRNNGRAIRAYLRAGYQIDKALCSDIGAGFVMDDFLMSCDLQPPSE